MNKLMMLGAVVALAGYALAQPINGQNASGIRAVDFSCTKITGGFWKEKQDLVRRATTPAVYQRFVETGRFGAFKCDWKKGMPHHPHVFWDSDVAKWLEGAAYLTALERDPELEKIVDDTVAHIAKNQRSDGYFNITYLVDKKETFVDRTQHELYCAGHLIEAAVAYFKATGKRTFLDCMCKYADYIEKRFKIDGDTAFSAPGHQELELALYRLFACTGEPRYRALAEHFVDIRGTAKDKRSGSYGNLKFDAIYEQAHKPVREQTEAVGHAVRATYLYCAMADYARVAGDATLKTVCQKLFDNIVTKRMFVTGGIGSSSCGESFTLDYDLPNIFPYTESCAAIGLALFANRMSLLDPDSKYADTVERILYNGFLSSLSLDGTSFFYENPLEIQPHLYKKDLQSPFFQGHNMNGAFKLPPAQRSRVFDCSCCPPNIVRFVPSVANFLYSDDGKTLYVHQFMNSETTLPRGNATLKVSQKTVYPTDGKVAITVTGGATRLAVRVPWWSDAYCGQTKKGYLYLDVKPGETVSLDFGMKTRFVQARPEVVFTVNRVAVMRGPVLYCMESVDNGANLRDLRLDRTAPFVEGIHPTLKVPTLTVRAYRHAPKKDEALYHELPAREEFVETKAILIPYHAFANRGLAEMQTWHYLAK